MHMRAPFPGQTGSASAVMIARAAAWRWWRDSSNAAAALRTW